jgi:hypothetical protein
MATIRNFGLLLVSLFPAVFGINYSTYTLPGEFDYGWDGLGRDWNGNIYVGLGNGVDYNPNSNAALYKFNFSTNAFDRVMDCRSVSQAAGNWKSQDLAGKIHSSIKQGKDGKMYFSTHCSIEGDGATGNDRTDYQNQYRGGHLYRFDPVAGQGEDVSAPGSSNHEGLMSPALGPWDPAAGDYKYLYAGNGYPYGNAYRLNVATGAHTVLFRTGASGGNISRKIFDDNDGRGYFPWTTGFLAVYDPVRDTLKRNGIYSRRPG